MNVSLGTGCEETILKLEMNVFYSGFFTVCICIKDDDVQIVCLRIRTQIEASGEYALVLKLDRTEEGLPQFSDVCELSP